MAPTTSGHFTGTHWEKIVVEPNVWILRCLGTFKNPKHRFLDGRTQDGTIGLAPTTDQPFSGTRWRAHDRGDGNFFLECLGDFKNPAFRFLDGRTDDSGKVGLAPHTRRPFTGTRWLVETGQPLDEGTNLIPA
jgi:hypothetical protein